MVFNFHIRVLIALHRLMGHPYPYTSNLAEMNGSTTMPSQKRTETAPQECDDAAQALSDASPDEAMLIGVDGTILAINNAAAHKNGKRPEEVIGRTLFDMYPHDLAKERKARIDEVVRSGAPIRFQEERDGIRVEHFLYPVCDSKGQVHQVAVFSYDITAAYRTQTDRDRFQNHVEAQKKTIDALSAALPDYVWIYDENMRFIYAGRAGAKMLGLTAGRMVGRTWSELGLPKDVMKPFEADVHYVFGTGQTARGEVRFPTIEGERMCEYTLAPIYDRAGKVEQVLSVARDISERKRAEERAEFLARFPEENPNPVMRLNTEGTILYANEAGRTLLDDWDNIERDAVPQLLRDAATEALSRQAQTTIEVSIHSRVYDFFVAPIIDGEYVNFYGRDITERKEAEEALQRARDELEHRVKERTLELQNEIEERKVIEEKLQRTTEELQGNIKELRRAEQSLQEHARKMDLLNQIIRASNEATDITSLAKLLVDHTIDLLDFDAGALFLFIEAENVIKLQYARGYSPDYAKERARVSVDEPHLILLYRDHEPLWSEHVQFIPPDVVEREHITAIAAVPLIAGRRVIGNLGISSSHRHQFTEAEKDILVTIGREVGTVIAKLKVEEDLRQRGEMLDLANDAVIIRDVNDCITYWNKGAERLYGWKEEEVLGMVSHELFQTVFPESRDVIMQAVYREGAWDGELSHTTRDNARLIVESHWTLYHDNDGKPSAIFEVSNDITERKKAEENARAASLYSRSLLEASLDPLVTISAEGKITDVNKATEDVTGFSRDELIGTDFSTYFTKPVKAKEGYQQVFTEGFVRDYPLAIRHTSGRITDVLYNATVYRNEAGEIQGVFAAARDVTERKRAEEALRRARDELEQIVQERTHELQEEIEEHKVTEEELRTTTEELREITQELRRSNKELEQFAYIASHDLQEPLRTVTSSIGLLENWYKGRLGAEADTFINYAVSGAKQMQLLIKDLLAYSRVTSRGESFAPVHCEDVFRHAIDNLKTAIEESEATITLPETMPMVMGDKMQLIQLFQNLIGNAIKFRSEQPPAVQIGVERDGERNDLLFSVRDNGIGMDMQYADKIFTIFQRLHTTEQYPGTGVGLALCKKIVERHGGRIWVESELGRGSTFYFTLPVSHTTET
jgi:PAS domain S-box-containing protein